MSQLTDIQVASVSPYSKRAAAAWVMEGARFHVWFNYETKELDKDHVIYKNPPFGVDHKHPDYFHTRHLNGDLPKNAEIIQRVFAEIDERGLIAAALAAEEEKEKQRRAKGEEMQRIARLKESGPALALALFEVVDAVCGLDRPWDLQGHGIDAKRAEEICELARLGSSR